MPGAVYRYRPLTEAGWKDKIHFEIVEEALFLAGLGQLNDPDEGRIRWVFEGTETEIFEFWVAKLRKHYPSAPELWITSEARERTDTVIREARVLRPEVKAVFNELIDNLVRVACFTTNPLNNPMWAHYGKWLESSGDATSHGGMCIEYAGGEQWRGLGLHPVSYCEGRPAVNLLLPDLDKSHRLAEALIVKTPKWEYEEEWRVIAHLDAQVPFPKNLANNSKLKLAGGVRSLIFGLKAKETLIKEVGILLKAHGRNVPLKRVCRHPETEELYITEI